MKSSSLSTSSIRNLLSRSMSSKQKSDFKNPKMNAENTPPLDPNILLPESRFSPLKPTTKPYESQSLTQQSSNPDPQIKKEISATKNKFEEPTTLDSPVKVVVRIRPENEHERRGDHIVWKISSESLSVGERNFTYDSVFDSSSNQEDIFQRVGAPLVKDALAGYNTTILLYGQSGSGKTYTMWGPQSSIFEEPSSSSQQGLVPRIFQKLFAEIEKEQENCEGKQINYQCRCSFLEIYNEQIGDLLDPTQRNLQIKDDLKNGLYVENLSEEYVTTYEDVTQILIKGLSSRKLGATTMNTKSSRSHIVFTCIIESWCKESTSRCFSSSKTSRISLVDLAGSDRNKIDDAGRQSVREAKSVKKSLSQLGYLVNSLAEKGKRLAVEHIPYDSSCLTHLLRESLGGNAKLTVICAISPDNKSESEILSTLRFGQRVKCIKNQPIVNEISEDDMNDLSDQIRQLKEELIRAKSSAHNSIGRNQGYFHGHKVRDSLNQLRVSLNRSLILPRLDCEVKEEEMNVDEKDVKEICMQIDNMNTCEKSSRESLEHEKSVHIDESTETDLSDYTNCQEDFEVEETNSRESHELSLRDSVASARDLRASIAISALQRTPILEEPALSESPKFGKSIRKSTTMSSSLLASNKHLLESEKFSSIGQSVRFSQQIRSSLQSSKLAVDPAESLAASLRRGLEIIEQHQKSPVSNESEVAFSFEHLALKPSPEADKANASVQTSPEGSQSSASFLCASCQSKIGNADSNEVDESLKMWIVSMDGSGNSKQVGSEMPKDPENGIPEAARREKELEGLCKEKEAKIQELICLVEQYKKEKELNCIEKGIVPYEMVKDEKQEIVKERYEVKEAEGELNCEGSGKFIDAKEKEELLKEIQNLRSQLQSCTDICPDKSTEKLRSSLLSRSIQLRKSTVSKFNSEEELENERQRWTEMESEWICLTDELRVDIEAHRQRAERLEMELKLEKNVTEELDDALSRSVFGHARMVEHYTELQEKYNDLVGKHRAIMEGIAEVKRAAAKAGAKGHGARFAKYMAAELSSLRVEREREREFLKKENNRLKIQLRDTAEAVHAAGELLVRLKEAEQATSAAEENFTRVQEENDKLRKQLEKQKRKHKMEMITMKQYLAESKLPGSALQPLYREDSDNVQFGSVLQIDDDQAWRAEFGAIYQNHY